MKNVFRKITEAILLFLCMGVFCFDLVSLSAADVEGGATVSGGTHATVDIQIPDSGANSARLYAWAAQDWEFVGSFLMAGSGWYKAVYQETIKQGENDASAGTTLSVATAFPAMMSGSIKYVGTNDGGGNEEVIMDWSVKANGNSTFKIKPQHTIVALNDTLPFYLDPNGGNVSVNWSFDCSLPAYSHTSTYSPSLPDDAPAGQYTVTATDVNNTSNKDIAQLEYVGVLNLTSGEITSPNDSNEVQTRYIPAGKSFTIKASRKPSSASNWPVGKPTWALSADSGNPALPEGATDLALPSDADGKDEITINPDPKIKWGKYTITAGCSADDSTHDDAKKTINIVINPVLVYSDTNRDGTINSEDILDRDKWIPHSKDQEGSGAICIPGNILKDPTDATKAINARDSTLQKIVLQKNTIIPEDMTLTLTSDNPTSFRLYDKDDKIIAVPNGGLAIPVNEINNGDIVYRISTTIRKEGLKDIKLTLTLKKGENKVFSDTLNLRIAPLILSSNMQPIQQEYIYTFADLSCLFWLQDYMELFSAHKDSGESTHIMIDLMHTDKTIYQEVRDILSAIRSGNNNSAYYKRVTNNAVAFYMQSFELANNDGHGGDIECTPPLKGKPFGRAILGSKSATRPIKELVNFQGIQTDIISIYTGVLSVGHVDELLSYITDDTVMIASPRRALDLLHAKLVTAATVSGKEDLANETIMASSKEFNPNDIDGDILIERDAINNLQEIRRFKIKDLLVMSKKDISQNKQFIESKNITIKKQAGGKYLLSNVNNTNLYEAENYIRVGNDYFQIDSITGATSFTAAFVASYKLNENKIVATTAPDYPQPTNIPYIYCTRAILVESIKAPNMMEFSDMLKSVTDKLGPLESQKTENKTKFIEIPILFVKNNIDKSGQPTTKGLWVAFSANMVNSLVDGSAKKIKALSPFNSTLENDFKDKIKSVDAEFTIDFIREIPADNNNNQEQRKINAWLYGHHLQGSIHCRTNARRKSLDSRWWISLPE